MRKTVKIMLTVLFTIGLIFSLSACDRTSNGAEAEEEQVVTVARGDLTIDITAAGNLVLSRTEGLTFTIAGTVEDVLVAEGDGVEMGQVLARLDTTSLNKAVAAAESAVRSRELDLKLADDSVTSAELDVELTDDLVTSAELDLESAVNGYQELITPYPYLTYDFFLPEVVDSIRQAQYSISEAQEENQKGLVGESYSLAEVKFSLAAALELLEDVEIRLAWGFDEGVRPSGLDYWTLRAAQMNVEKAELALSRAEVNQEKAELALSRAEVNQEKSRQALDEATDDLDEVTSEMDEALITAPFDGFITRVNVEGGDDVQRGTVAVVIADPNRFKADILVSEMDIMQVMEGGEAWVQLDAMSGLTLPATVTHIAPTATIQTGVVNYMVTVEIESMEAVIGQWQQKMPDTSSGELSEKVKQAIEQGLITQEQVDEMTSRLQQRAGEKQGQLPMTPAEDFQLREGLTATVSVIVDGRSDVLLVPNAAITFQGGQPYVRAVLPDGTIEERAIQFGISDWQYTEVTGGLDEGEQVLVPKSAASTTMPQDKEGGSMLPGMGKLR